eukprot:6649735-Ditylum_brightwellii.AAC.2
MIGPAAKGEDDLCKVRVLNSTNGHSVPISTLSSVTTPGPIDIPQHSADTDHNSLESLISKEDLEMLWHKDQVTLSYELKLYLY